MKKRYLPLCFIIFLIGILCAIWYKLWLNETDKSLMAASLFISFIALFISSYITIENAIELRSYNKRKLFSDYCVRFSNDQNIKKVAEWLLAIAEFDSNGNILNVYPKRLKDDKGRTIIEPTYFEKERFFNFLKELNIQIKNRQLEKEDVNNLFSIYASLFYKVKLADDKTIYYMQSNADLADFPSELFKHNAC